jgi:hypothetical protein
MLRTLTCKYKEIYRIRTITRDILTKQ